MGRAVTFFDYFIIHLLSIPGDVKTRGADNN